MGDNVGKAAVEGHRERERHQSLPPQPVRQFSDLAKDDGSIKPIL